jgi:NADH-quinone oxidoreductase subunit H
MKEDLIPAAADRPLFRLAPYLVMVGVFSAFASVPFGMYLIAADLNVGVLFILAISSLGTVGILMSGWASNNKWSLLGGIRSAAQIVSYEVPALLGALSPVLLAGTLQMSGSETEPGIVASQGGWPWEWFVFRNPFALGALLVYFIAAVAEGNRTPFDLPEAESELVAGFNTEYSGMRFAGFFLAEFANVYLVSAVATALFFGGWQVPGLSLSEQASSPWWIALGLVIFVAKASSFCFVIVWLRWTLPRLRVDQLMGLCYRYLLPLGLLFLLGNGSLMLIAPQGSTADWVLRLLTLVPAAAVMVLFFWRVAYHIRQVGDRVDLDLLARGVKGRFHPERHRHYGKLASRTGKGATP